MLIYPAIILVILFLGTYLGLPLPILIISSAALGYIWYGWLGLFFGLCFSYIATILIGVVLGKLQGGLVPKKTKKKTASGFIETHRELVNKVLAHKDSHQKQKYIENMIEKFFRESAKNTSTFNPKSGLSMENVSFAADTIIQYESNGEKKELLSELAQYVFKHMY